MDGFRKGTRGLRSVPELEGKGRLPGNEPWPHSPPLPPQHSHKPPAQMKAVGLLCAATFLEARASDCYQHTNHKHHHLLLGVLWPVQVRHFLSWAQKLRNVVWEHSLPPSNDTVQPQVLRQNREKLTSLKKCGLGVKLATPDQLRCMMFTNTSVVRARHVADSKTQRKWQRNKRVTFRFVESPWLSWDNIQFCSLIYYM